MIRSPQEPELILLQTDRAGARSVTARTPALHSSRSYRAPWALVARHEHRVGVDLERISDSDRAFARSICTPDELLAFTGLLDDDGFVASLWSSKEALAKALGNAVDYDPRRLASPLTWPTVAHGPHPHADGANVSVPVPVPVPVPGRDALRCAGNWYARQLLAPEIPDGHVGWLVWRR